MDLGLAFEDEDLLCDERNRTGDRDVPYNVKICSDQWFDTALLNLENMESSGEDVDLEQHQTMLKFSADFSYHEKDYSPASKKYKKLFGTLSQKNNSAMRHDVQESLSRCYVYIGQTDEGLEIARDMVKAASKEDEARKRQALALLSFACEKAQKWAVLHLFFIPAGAEEFGKESVKRGIHEIFTKKIEEKNEVRTLGVGRAIREECVEALEKLCDLQAQFPQTWLKLGDIYSHLSMENAFHSSSSTCEDDILLVKQLSSYLRAKFLFQAVMGTASEFIFERNKDMIQQLAHKIDQIPMSSSRKQFASEFIKKEFENQATSNKEISVNGENPTTTEPSLGNFYEKFCSWNLCCER